MFNKEITNSIFKILSTSGLVLSFKDNHLSLPRLYFDDITSRINCYYNNIVWKINVKKINSPDVFIKFIIERNVSLII